MSAPSLLLPEFPVVEGYARHAGSQFHRTPPHSRAQIAEWQRQLDERVPRTEHLPWLYLRWEAGDEWQPIQRYVLWEMIPNEYETEPGKWRPSVPAEIRADLEGPSPRSTGFYDPNLKQWRGGACKSAAVDLATWEVFHETGRLFGTKQWGLRYWAIQGSHGGHPLHEPFAVQTVRRLLRPDAPETELPPIGDLPYAPPDNRVFDKIGGYDKYREWRMACDFAFRNKAHMDALDLERAEQAAAQMTAWWDAQVGEVLQEFSRSRLSEVGWEAKGMAANKEMGSEGDQDEVTRRQMIEQYLPR